ncbi:uncharacterized protein LOC126377918 isoform X2 [Pectinophora gossypiella]|uniref:uncharacterized protein LOC126368676 n=1 Tax=Pectinophora gossypiella TaxID=13191 RepID=UPI00214E40AE|nr:uncharacterized protein LOC126368676 [Pectinophora gossypiella]XP_049881930.1 uncharacterized protein LOC126377918 isoform X2 [Pectinophora gossypiella]
MSSRKRVAPRERAASPHPNVGSLAATMDAILNRLATLEQRASTPASEAPGLAITQAGHVGGETAPLAQTRGRALAPVPETSMPPPLSGDGRTASPASSATSVAATPSATERLIEALRSIQPV